MVQIVNHLPSISVNDEPVSDVFQLFFHTSEVKCSLYLPDIATVQCESQTVSCMYILNHIVS